MRLFLFLLPAALLAQPAPCPLSVTNGTSTICLVGPAGPPGPPGSAGAQGPPGPAGPGVSTITVSPDGSTTTIKGNVVVTGNLSTGSAGTATQWSVTRSDGKVCTMTFQPANPDTTSTLIVIKCP